MAIKTTPLPTARTAAPVKVATGLAHILVVTVVVKTEVTAVQDMFPNDPMVLVTVPEVRVVVGDELVADVEGGEAVMDGTAADRVTPTVRQRL